MMIFKEPKIFWGLFSVCLKVRWICYIMCKKGHRITVSVIYCLNNHENLLLHGEGCFSHRVSFGLTRSLCWSCWSLLTYVGLADLGWPWLKSMDNSALFNVSLIFWQTSWGMLSWGSGRTGDNKQIFRYLQSSLKPRLRTRPLVPHSF